MQAEREQGITIDVAYRYFSTRSVNLLMAAPGGIPAIWRPAPQRVSSAILLINASKGVFDQTRRHSFIFHAVGDRTYRWSRSTKWIWWITVKDLTRIRKDYLVGRRSWRSGYSPLLCRSLRWKATTWLRKVKVCRGTAVDTAGVLETVEIQRVVDADQCASRWHALIADGFMVLERWRPGGVGDEAV